MSWEIGIYFFCLKSSFIKYGRKIRCPEWLEWKEKTCALCAGSHECSFAVHNMVHVEQPNIPFEIRHFFLSFFLSIIYMEYKQFAVRGRIRLLSLERKLASANCENLLTDWPAKLLYRRMCEEILLWQIHSIISKKFPSKVCYHSIRTPCNTKISHQKWSNTHHSLSL